jgi:hypothetical protein
MLDLCSGFGGASAAMQARGWTVVRIDSEPRVLPDVAADIRALPLHPFPVDLIWASPPCNAYSRWMQRASLYPDENKPTHDLYEAVMAVIAQWQPRYWCLENVRGAVEFWGPPAVHFGSRYLWSNIPAFVQPVFATPIKRRLCWGSDPLRSAKRGYIPYSISEAIALSVEAAR